MIVTCPACSSRYRFDEQRLDGRSAKITCPSCGHVYIVHPPRVEPGLVSDTWPSEAMGEEEAESLLDGGPSPGPDIRTADFPRHGVTWKVRQGLGLIHDFRNLGELEEALEDGIVGRMDELSYDGRNYTRIAQIDDIEALFRDVWERALRGEITTQETTHFVIGGDAEGDEDAPTTIVRTGTRFNLDLDVPEPEPEPEPEDDAPVPPPPALMPALGSPDMPDAPTEDAHETDAGADGPPAAVPPPKPATTRPADGGGSKGPLIALVVVIVVVLGLILWRQGVFDGFIGG